MGNRRWDRQECLSPDEWGRYLPVAMNLPHEPILWVGLICAMNHHTVLTNTLAFAGMP
jgi:hypothetical protein